MVDATKVSKMKIDTGYAGVKEYPIFTRPDGKAAQCAIILGKNGSGKSTLARALGIDVEGTEFFDKSGNSLGDDCSNVHIFNEYYVAKNFRTYEASSIAPVLLLGEAAEISDEINKLKDNISSNKKYIESLKAKRLSGMLDAFSPDVDIPFVGFTLKEYVNALIDNEIILQDDLLFCGDELDDLPAGNLYERTFAAMLVGTFFSKEEYVRCIAQGVQRKGSEICEDVISSAKSGCSLSVIKDEMRKALESLRGNWTSSAYKEIEHSWHNLSFWIMFFIYREFGAVFYEIDAGVLSKKDRDLIRGCKEEIYRLERQLRVWEDKLEEIRKEESSKPVIAYINELLHVVFGEDCMNLESSVNGGYCIKSNDQIISPYRLSVGEQNILSICYFFTSLAYGKKIEHSMTCNQIIVLDDPVSSFDDGNKYGVTSLLGYLCQTILGKSSKTKLIIMTHDPSFALNMSKMVKAIDGAKLSCWVLKNDSSDSLVKSNFGDIDRYADVLRGMYDFALQEEESLVAPTPNDVRRIWEAFLSFELGETSIANMESLKKLSGYFSKHQKIERFMRVFIPQLFINNDSHAKSQVMNGNLYLTPTLEGKPYEDFVKNIVCFMHIVSPRHIAWRMKKSSGENVQDFVVKLDNLVREVLDDSKIVAATSPWQGNQGLRRARHRGGRASLGIRRQAAKR
ncbi:AAA family ATPase [uncultured Rothia sp.]|uniref:AAA family ATPase n=1 Tax=uncultured Rothia sp. TaxID=316088 RepID=UPI002632E552|nr:AAA family ATPase [uncultured Rothia sp.]